MFQTKSYICFWSLKKGSLRTFADDSPETWRVNEGRLGKKCDVDATRNGLSLESDREEFEVLCEILERNGRKVRRIISLQNG